MLPATMQLRALLVAQRDRPGSTLHAACRTLHSPCCALHVARTACSAAAPQAARHRASARPFASASTRQARRALHPPPPTRCSGETQAPPAGTASPGYTAASIAPPVHTEAPGAIRAAHTRCDAASTCGFGSRAHTRVHARTCFCAIPSSEARSSRSARSSESRWRSCTQFMQACPPAGRSPSVAHWVAL
jgi:hypothetical protein